jgi:hypothetical protein
MSGEGVRKGSHKGLIIGIVFLAVIIVVLFIPMIPVDTTYNDTEPYDRLGTYQVVSATLTQEYELLGRGVYHRSTVVVKNIDSYGGTFTVNHYLYDVNGLFGSKTTSGYIGAGSTQNFVAEFDTSLGQDVRAEYTVSAPTVIDQKVVTKHKTVYKSIIELLVYH